MRDIKIAATQFEGRDADKDFNLSRIREQAATAAEQGAELVLFQEMAVTHYSFVQSLSREEMSALAESVPDGPSTKKLIEFAAEAGITVCAGLLEIENDKLYNTQVVVNAGGLIAKHRKLHPFVSKHLTAGDDYTVFDLHGCRFGILTCYDNNLPENVRITAMLGAEIILMPHVTCGTESVMPGRGIIDRKLWENRGNDPVSLRQEFLGPKGRAWLMRWLPARAWENGVYVVFANPVGIDADTVKPGLAMIIDPFGEVLVESHALGDDVVTGFCTAEKYELASGRRYIRARRPELYDKLTESSSEPPLTQPGWALKPPEEE